MAGISDALIVTFAQDLVCDGADSTSLTNFVGDLRQNELSQLPDGWTGQTSFTTTTAGTATVDLSTGSSHRKILAIFHGGRLLSHESLAALEAIGADWHSRIGTPRAWTEVREQDGTIRLYPVPSTTTQLTGTLATEVNRLTVLSIGTGAGSLPTYLRLPAALWILSREYARESRYRDMDFSKIAQALAERMFQMVDGVAVPPPGKPE